MSLRSILASEGLIVSASGPVTWPAVMEALRYKIKVQGKLGKVVKPSLNYGMQFLIRFVDGQDVYDLDLDRMDVLRMIKYPLGTNIAQRYVQGSPFLLFSKKLPLPAVEWVGPESVEAVTDQLLPLILKLGAPHGMTKWLTKPQMPSFIPVLASRTLLTCRTCGTSVSGTTNGTVSKPGWHKILRIDGPNAMCPECVKDKDALEGLAEDGYLDAKIGPEMPFDPSIKSAAAEEKPFGVQLSGRGDDYKTKVVSKHTTEDEAKKAMAVLKAKMTSTDKAHGAVYKVVKVPAKTAALVLTKGDYIEVAGDLL